MTQPRYVRLQVEELDARILPSVTLPAIPVDLDHHGIPWLSCECCPDDAPTNYHGLSGDGQGKFTTEPMPTRGGYRLNKELKGVADLGTMGTFAVAGSVYEPGWYCPPTCMCPVVWYNASGVLTFTNARGSISVQLQGHPTAPVYHIMGTSDDVHPAVRSAEGFSYKVISGTGAYRNVQDSGTVRFQFNWAGSFTFTIQSWLDKVPPPGHGHGPHDQPSHHHGPPPHDQGPADDVLGSVMLGLLTPAAVGAQRREAPGVAVSGEHPRGADVAPPHTDELAVSPADHALEKTPTSTSERTHGKPTVGGPLDIHLDRSQALETVFTVTGNGSDKERG